jgi:hypothetical protein
MLNNHEGVVISTGGREAAGVEKSLTLGRRNVAREIFLHARLTALGRKDNTPWDQDARMDTTTKHRTARLGPAGRTMRGMLRHEGGAEAPPSAQNDIHKMDVGKFVPPFVTAG